MIFALCSVVAAAGFAFAFEGGRVCERRLLGFTAPPYKNWPGRGMTVMTVLFLLIVAAEYFVLPKWINPFTALVDPDWHSTRSPLTTSALVFGSWSGILALGYGLLVAWGRSLHNERKMYEMDKADFERNRLIKEKKLQEEKLVVKKERAELHNARAVVVDQQEQLQVQALLLEEEADKMIQHMAGEDFTPLPEGERVWSRKLFNRLDVKAFSIAKAALDKRWNELEEWESSSFEMLKRRKQEQEEMLLRMRERRQERVKVNKDELEDERDNLRRLTQELEALRMDMAELNEESKTNEEEQFVELNHRIQLTMRQDNDFRAQHSSNLKKITDEASPQFDSPSQSETLIMDTPDDERYDSKTQDDQQDQRENVRILEEGDEGIHEQLSTIDEVAEDEGSSSSRVLSSNEDDIERSRDDVDLTVKSENASLPEADMEWNNPTTTNSPEITESSNVPSDAATDTVEDFDETLDVINTASPSDEPSVATTNKKSTEADTDVAPATVDPETHHSPELSPVEDTLAVLTDEDDEIVEDFEDDVNRRGEPSSSEDEVLPGDSDAEDDEVHKPNDAVTTVSGSDLPVTVSSSEGICEESRLPTLDADIPHLAEIGPEGETESIDATDAESIDATDAESVDATDSEFVDATDSEFVDATDAVVVATIIVDGGDDDQNEIEEVGAEFVDATDSEFIDATDAVVVATIIDDGGDVNWDEAEDCEADFTDATDAEFIDTPDADFIDATDVVATIIDDGGDDDRNEVENNATLAIKNARHARDDDERYNEEEGSYDTDIDDDDDDDSDDDDDDDEYEMAYCDESSVAKTSFVMDDAEDGNGVEIVVGILSKDTLRQ